MRESNRIGPRMFSSAFGRSKCRMRPFCTVIVPVTSGASQAALERRLQRGAARAAHVGEEALQDAEVGVAAHPHGDALVVQVGGAGDLELGVLAGQPEIGEADDVAVERDVNRRGVAHLVVEEARVEAVDGRVHQQVVEVGQLADDAHAAAHDRRGVGREPRLEGTDVRVERACR